MSSSKKKVTGETNSEVELHLVEEVAFIIGTFV